MPIFRISVDTCRRPAAMPSKRRKSRSIRAPANGWLRRDASIRRISAKSPPETGCGT
jgi:hypothetical protein